MDRDSVNDRRLSFRARGILLWLLDKPDDWRCDSDTLTRNTTEGRDAVRTALKELETCGYLVRSKYQDARGHWQSEAVIYETPGRTEDGIPVVGNPTVGSPDVGSPGPLMNTVTDDCDRTPVVPAKPGSLDIVDGRFTLFWAQWPLKTDKKAAEKAFKKAMSIADHEDVIAGLQPWLRYWESRDNPYIPYPATWLNKERWKDDPPPLNGSTPKMSKGAQSAIKYRERMMNR
jgi:hypothetical protein